MRAAWQPLHGGVFGVPTRGSADSGRRGRRLPENRCAHICLVVVVVLAFDHRQKSSPRSQDRAPKTLEWKNAPGKTKSHDRKQYTSCICDSVITRKTCISR